MTITAEQVEAALATDEPRAGYGRGGLTPLVGQIDSELRAWGHAECEVVLERIVPLFGDPCLLRGDFWCETCHVSQLVRLKRPEAE